MRYADNWTILDISHLDLEIILIWCSENLKGKQFVEGNNLKFDNKEEAVKFKLNYKE